MLLILRTFLHFSTVRSPFRFDLNDAHLSGSVVKEARPWPLFRLRNKTAPHRIAMHVLQLFDAFVFVMNVEIIIPPLPERKVDA